MAFERRVSASLRQRRDEAVREGSNAAIGKNAHHFHVRSIGKKGKRVFFKSEEIGRTTVWSPGR
jgi:hypothetical protein